MVIFKFSKESIFLKEIFRAEIIISFIIFLGKFCPGHCKTNISNNFCDQAASSKLIGDSIRIKYSSAIYQELNYKDTLDWPSAEIKILSDKKPEGSYYPVAGDTGIIIHIFKTDFKNKPLNYNLYIIKVKNLFFLIRCWGLLGIHQYTDLEQDQYFAKYDSIRRVTYEAGCEFRTNRDMHCWTRPGVFKIDRLSENFTCKLKGFGVDTLLLYKYIFDNGAGGIEKAFVMWIENGKGHIKSFRNFLLFFCVTGIQRRFDFYPIIKAYKEYHIDTVQTNPTPKYWASHDMGASIQFSIPGEFFCQRIPDYYILGDPQHPKSKWWIYIGKKLRMKYVRKLSID